MQYVIRPQSHRHVDYRGYAGQVAGGIFKPGDEVMVLPSGFGTTIIRSRQPMARSTRRSADVGDHQARGRDRRLPRGHDLQTAQPADDRPGPGRDGVLDDGNATCNQAPSSP